ncbi:hypothetical protein ACWGIU_01895 [Streptomyces sp. NPDC054840]
MALTVRTIRLLAVGQTTVPEPGKTSAAPAAAAGPEAPVRTRDMAPEGFHRALAAHQTVPRTREVALDIAEAAARKPRVLRELRQEAFPETEEAPIDSAALQRRRAFAATETAAVHRARAERARWNTGLEQRREYRRPGVWMPLTGLRVRKTC